MNAARPTKKAISPEVRLLIEAMDQVLDDMGPDSANRSVCLATKALARVAFEPFLEPECREFVMSLNEARDVLAEVGL